MPYPSHQTQRIAGKATKLQVRIVALAADQTEMDVAVLDGVKDLLSVRDLGAHLDMRVALAERCQQIGKQVLAGHRAGGEEQFTGERRLEAGHRGDGLSVQRQNALGVFVKTPARVGQGNVPRRALE